MARELYPPEGRCAAAPPYTELLAHAGSEAIFQAMAVKCTDNRSLVVELPGGQGIIPRGEVALGAEEGRVRDIAIISRVGRPVCFTVEGPGEGGRVLLSRRRAQQAAMLGLLEARPGDILAARVTHMEGFGVFVDIGCGVVSFIGIENISVSRIPHPSSRFAQGQDILAAVLTVEEQPWRITLTHRELLGTWQENAAGLAPGDTVQGIVRGIEPYGMFIELTPNLSGLAELRPGFEVGDRVSVFIKSLAPDRMKVKLAAVDRLPPSPPRLICEGDYFVWEGRLNTWRYSPAGSRKLIERTFTGQG